jgi:hypothetical protein
LIATIRSKSSRLCAHDENAGVADEDVKKAERFCRPGYSSSELAGRGAVGLQGERDAPCRFDLAHELEGLFF